MALTPGFRNRVPPPSFACATTGERAVEGAIQHRLQRLRRGRGTVPSRTRADQRMPQRTSVASRTSANGEVVYACLRSAC